MSKNHQTKEYRIMRSVALWLHDYKCYIKKCSSTAMDVHHGNKKSYRNYLQNLIPLCSKCHKMVHKTNATIRISSKEIIIMLLKKVEFFSRQS